MWDPVNSVHYDFNVLKGKKVTAVNLNQDDQGRNYTYDVQLCKPFQCNGKPSNGCQGLPSNDEVSLGAENGERFDADGSQLIIVSTMQASS